MLVDMANTIDPARYSVSVCITRSGEALAKEIRSDIPVYKLNRRFSWDPSGFTKLKKVCNEQGLDLLHAHGRSTFAFLAVAKRLGFIKQPILFHDHQGRNSNQNYFYWCWSSLVKELSHYVGVCDDLLEWANSLRIPSSHISILKNSQNLRRYEIYQPINLHRQLNLDFSQRIGIMVGNLRPEKGLDLLIEACAKIPRAFLPIFVIVGGISDNSYFQECKNHIRNLQLEDNFHFVGKKDDCISWIKGADFGVIPSRSESGPLVLIEFLACGLPFVSFNVGGVSQIVQKEIPSAFIEPANTDLFAGALEAMVKSSPSELHRRSEQGKVIAYDNFDIRKRLPEWYSVYEQIIEDVK